MGAATQFLRAALLIVALVALQSTAPAGAQPGPPPLPGSGPPPLPDNGPPPLPGGPPSLPDAPPVVTGDGSGRTDAGDGIAPDAFFPGRWIADPYTVEVEGFGPGTYRQELLLRRDGTYSYDWREVIETDRGTLRAKVEENGTYTFEPEEAPHIRIRINGTSTYTDLSDPDASPEVQAEQGYFRFAVTDEDAISDPNTTWRRAR